MGVRDQYLTIGFEDALRRAGYSEEAEAVKECRESGKGCEDLETLEEARQAFQSRNPDFLSLLAGEGIHFLTMGLAAPNLFRESSSVSTPLRPLQVRPGANRPSWLGRFGISLVVSYLVYLEANAALDYTTEFIADVGNQHRQGKIILPDFGNLQQACTLGCHEEVSVDSSGPKFDALDGELGWVSREENAQTRILSQGEAPLNETTFYGYIPPQMLNPTQQSSSRGLRESDDTEDEADHFLVTATIQQVLDGITEPATALSSLSDYFHLSEGTIQGMIHDAHLLEGICRHDPEQDTAEVLYNLFKKYQGRSSALQLVRLFLNADDWQQHTHKELETFDQALLIAEASYRHYLNLGPIPYSFYDSEAIPQYQIARQRIADSRFFIEVWNGTGVVRGGFEVRLTDERGHIVAYFQFMFGNKEIIIVGMKGGSRYRADHQELIKILGTNPFDWLVLNLGNWAVGRGYDFLRGYDYGHDAWLRRELQSGLIPQARRPYLARMYEERYLRLGMKPQHNNSGAYEKQLKMQNIYPCTTLTQPFYNLLDYIEIGQP